MAHEHIVLVAGPMGAGKTTAIASLSEVPVVCTEATNTDLVHHSKATTTVALDYGEIALTDGDRVRLYGVPGQERFEFMWRILAPRALGLLLLVDNASEDPLGDFGRYLAGFVPLLRAHSVVVGITRRDVSPQPGLDEYRSRLGSRAATVPMFEVDAREPAQMRTLLFTLVAMVEAHAEVSDSAYAAQDAPA